MKVMLDFAILNKGYDIYTDVRYLLDLAKKIKVT